jgi:osmotically-inducible protein OsmY
MNRILAIAAAAFTALVSNIAAAEGGSYSTQPAAKPQQGSGQATGTTGQAQQTAPDNTGRNEADRQAGKLEATDQSNDPRDVELTRKIRKALTDSDSLSVNAQNIKIITVGGKVTLRGPVRSEDERKRIEAAARRAAGSATVVNELQVNQR